MPITAQQAAQTTPTRPPHTAKAHVIPSPHKTQGTHPFTRLKSASCVTSSGKFFLFGGFDEDDVLDGSVYLFDVKSETWETVSATDAKGTKGKVFREGHSVLALPGDEDKVIVFGGVPPNEGEANGVGNNAVNDTIDLLLFDMKLKKWVDIPAPPDTSPSNGPAERSRHAACLSPDGTRMFISGGLDKDNYSLTFDDLYCYDITTSQWSQPRKFIARFDHQIVYHEGKIWSFGGLSNDMAHVNEISWYDIECGDVGSVRMEGVLRLEGDHIFIDSACDSGVVLDVVVPLVSYEVQKKDIQQPCIGIYDITALRHWSVFNSGGRNLGPLSGFSWRHCFVFEGSVFFLGYEVTEDMINEDAGFEEYSLDSIVGLPLADLGIRSAAVNDEAERKAGSLVGDFKELLYSGDYADFEIIGVDSVDRPPLNAQIVEPSSSSSSPSIGSVFQKSKPIPTHKLILHTRWPFLRTLLSSGMSESQSNKLFLPEPVAWIKILLEYLYTDSIPAQTHSEMEIMTGLLILSNLYDLPALRPIALREIYGHGFLQPSTVILIWTRARFIGEEALAYSAKQFLYLHWGQVVRSERFEKLSKAELLELVGDVAGDTMILSSSFSHPHPRQTSLFGVTPMGSPYQNQHYDYKSTFMMTPPTTNPSMILESPGSIHSSTSTIGLINAVSSQRAVLQLQPGSNYSADPNASRFYEQYTDEHSPYSPEL